MKKKQKSVMDRFLSHVNKTDYCWEWTASKYDNSRGYGCFNLNSIAHRSHRIAYTLFVGDIPEGMCVLHKCDNPICVNPDHLWIGTRDENNKDRKKKQRGARNNGETNGFSKIDSNTVKEIRRMREEEGLSYGKLCNVFNLSKSHIARIIHRKAWSHI